MRACWAPEGEAGSRWYDVLWKRNIRALNRDPPWGAFASQEGVTLP